MSNRNSNSLIKFVLLISASLTLASCLKDNSSIKNDYSSSIGINESTDESSLSSEESSISSESTTSISENEESSSEEPIEEIDYSYLEDLNNYESIEYSNHIKNKISAYYTSKNKDNFVIENENMSMTYNMAKDNLCVSSFKNERGESYIENTFDSYVVVNSKKSYASSSYVEPRVNIYKFGYYYYDIHLLEQSFANSPTTGEGLNLLENREYFGSKDVSNIEYSEDGVLSYIVNSTYDPYVSIPTNYLASEYQYLYLRIKSSSNRGWIYFKTDTTGMQGDHNISFSMVGDNQYHEYYIRMDVKDVYKDTILTLRLDIGSQINEVVEVSDFVAYKESTNENNIGLDRTYHTYGDKLHNEDRFVFLKDVNNVTEIGQEIKIPKNRVSSVKIVNYDNNPNPVAIGFSIINKGVIGFISANNNKQSIALSSDENNYIVQMNKILVKTNYKKKDVLNIGFRIYNSLDNSLDGFIEETRKEYNPLEYSVKENEDNASILGYDYIRGAYIVSIDGTGFNDAYYINPQKQFIADITFNTSENRKIYLILGTYVSGCLECASILDGNDNQLPIPIEVCKNFKGEIEEPIYDPSDSAYGEAIVALDIRGNKDNEYKLIHLYQNWGTTPLKQLSSIQFVTPYYHLSTGCTETNCIATQYIDGNSYLPDFRSMSAPFWSNQPQHTSMGKMSFLSYLDENGNKIIGRHIKDKINSSGPTYADVELDYISSDNKISGHYRHIEMPQLDENRTYYEVKFTFNEDISFNNFKNDFDLFSLNSRGLKYEKIGYLNENNIETIEASNTSISENKLIKLGNNQPYFDYYQVSNNDDYVNFGLLVKDYTVINNNEQITPSLVIKDCFNINENNMGLSLDLDNITFKKGDFISINLILVPWGSQLTTNDSNIRELRNNTLINPFEIKANKGNIIESPYIKEIKVDDKQECEFTLSKGNDNIVIRAYGFKKYGVPYIEQLINNEWVKVNNNYYNYDGYVIHLDEDRTFSYSFILNSNLDSSKTIRLNIR